MGAVPGGNAEGAPCSLSQQETSPWGGALEKLGLVPPPRTTEAWGEFSQALGVEAAGLGQLQPLQVLLEDLPSLLQRAEQSRGVAGDTSGVSRASRREATLSRPGGQRRAGRPRASMLSQPVWVSDQTMALAAPQMQRTLTLAEAALGPASQPCSPRPVQPCPPCPGEQREEPAEMAACGSHHPAFG